jgi:ketopantoate hydroxymethyltransferase
MSAVKGVNNTKVVAPSPTNILDPGLVGGRVRVSQDTYEASGLAAASTIAMCGPLPVGAKVVGISLAHDALGAAATLAVGDSTTAARYLAAASAVAAGSRNALLVDGLNFEITSTTTQILITTADYAATGTIKLTVFWTME